MINNNLIGRLTKVLSHIEGISYEELEWLAGNGNFEVYEAGTLLARKGKRIEKLWIILSGCFSVKRDRGAGPQLVTQWCTGDVSGMLPYSRMKGPQGDIYLEERAELLAIHEKQFPKMIHQCPVFTAYTVHSMIDRARSFKTSELYNEKMMSLGKLAAGLAHELNNPASAAVRGAKMLLSDIDKLETASRMLGTVNLRDDLLDMIKQVHSVCLTKPASSILSPIRQAEHEDNIANWLLHHNLDLELAESLAATAVTIDELNKLADAISGSTLDIAVQWIAASINTRSIAVDIEQSTTRISDLVSAVKRFTYMDKLVESELVDVETGLRDTIMIVAAKAKSKGAAITLDVETNLPRVQASGGELNQVWLNLIDNALDAIPNSGSIDVNARMEQDRVVVRIVDNGSGISPEIVSRIFDPFFTTKPSGQGTGLGLDITRHIIRRYHGDIDVQSRPGLTEFRVSLVIRKSVKEEVDQPNKLL